MQIIAAHFSLIFLLSEIHLYLCFMAGFMDTDIKYMAGVGPKRAEILRKELQVATFGDMLYYFPYKYIDRTKFHTIRELNTSSAHVQIKGMVRRKELQGEGKKQRLVVTFADEAGSIELIWFSGIKYIQDNLKVNEWYVAFGKPTVFNSRFNIAHPEIELASVELEKKNVLQAFYNTSDRMKKSFISTKAISKIQENISKSAQGNIYETLPKSLVGRLHLMPLAQALLQIHFPESTQLLQYATFRLKFDELFYIQLKIQRLKFNRQNSFKGFVFSEVGDYFNTFYKDYLPFELTGAQKKVIKEVRQDMRRGVQMNRLVQGDVGSGKTLVALMCALLAFDNGYQACLMAPTEILATQHHASITKMLGNLRVNVALLTGSTKKKARETIHAGLQDGTIQLLIGTHALIEDTVQLNKLGLVIVDEQHRFGVAQRAKLWEKNSDTPPHVLIMTATPIPRTLAMTLYGDLDISVIDELPPGRKSIETRHYLENRRLQVYDFIRKEIAKGRQAYIVYPLVKESEKMDLKNVEDGFAHMKEVFPQCEISMVHGQMKPVEKEKEMMRFKQGETQIMVATTVIEVGVDVPNASIMVIESAERFGLSQLHQLRGRVGRGAEQSYCLLMSGYKLSNTSRKRLETMVRTNDGFEIAEVDLQLRGAGDIEGTQQSGEGFELKIAKLGKDGEILRIASETANEVLTADPKLETQDGRLLQYYLDRMKTTEFDWSVIS
ncbi:MAG: ATP-dependent DNA helicase RecG [Mangrovibacterium sp.]